MRPVSERSSGRLSFKCAVPTRDQVCACLREPVEGPGLMIHNSVALDREFEPNEVLIRNES